MSATTSDRHGSGNERADRRAALAETYGKDGEFAAAADLMRQALEIAPGWALGHVRRAHFLAEAGETTGAAAALRKALALHPDDRYGASLILARLGEGPVPDAPPPAFVETLFDDYAPRFDAALRDRLAYVVPELLMEDLLAEAGLDRRFRSALDLGCGTGLMGVGLRQLTARLDGVDLSAAMLAQARGKRLYDDLDQHDLTSGAALPGGSRDLVTAADVFLYLGDLTPVLHRIAASCEPGALLAFSVEAGPDDEAFVLRPSLRYAHGLAPLLSALDASGFDVRSQRRAVIRQDRGEAVEGHILIAALG